MCWDHAIALSGIQKSLSPSQNIHYFGILKGEGESVHVHTHTPTFFKHRKPLTENRKTCLQQQPWNSASLPHSEEFKAAIFLMRLRVRMTHSKWFSRLKWETINKS